MKRLEIHKSERVNSTYRTWSYLPFLIKKNTSLWIPFFWKKSKCSFTTLKREWNRNAVFIVGPSTYLTCLLNHRRSIVLPRNSSLPSRPFPFPRRTPEHDATWNKWNKETKKNFRIHGRRHRRSTYIIRVRSGVPVFSAQGPWSPHTRPPKAYKTERNDEKCHKARRTSRATITVVRKVINIL